MKVSIIIPCYNVENYVADCLNSVGGQTFENLEVICVDDGSSDNTLQIVQDYQKNSKLPLKIIEQQNKGACAARNAGLKEAQGEYIQFLDADDILKEEKIEKQVGLLTSTPVAIVVGAFERFKEGGNKTGEFVPDSSVSPWIELMRTRLGITSSNLFNRGLIEKIGGWDESLQSSQEANLMFRLLKENTDILYDTTPLTTIRSRESGSISQIDPKANWQRYARLREEIYLHVDKKNLAPNREAKAALFDTIHILYPYDKELALELYRKHLKGKFKPKATEVVSKGFAILTRVLGFPNAADLKIFVK